MSLQAYIEQVKDLDKNIIEKLEKRQLLMNMIKKISEKNNNNEELEKLKNDSLLNIKKFTKKFNDDDLDLLYNNINTLTLKKPNTVKIRRKSSLKNNSLYHSKINENN